MPTASMHRYTQLRCTQLRCTHCFDLTWRRNFSYVPGELQVNPVNDVYQEWRIPGMKYTRDEVYQERRIPGKTYTRNDVYQVWRIPGMKYTRNDPFTKMTYTGKKPIPVKTYKRNYLYQEWRVTPMTYTINDVYQEIFRKAKAASVILTISHIEWLLASTSRAGSTLQMHLLAWNGAPYLTRRNQARSKCITLGSLILLKSTM